MNANHRGALAALALLGLTHAAQAALVARDLTGDNVADAYYDSVLNITWLADWNRLQTSGLDADGRVGWSTAMGWAAGLTVGTYDDWRLPTLSPVGGGATFDLTPTSDGSSDLGFAHTGVGWGLASEFGHLYYVTLENDAEPTLPPLTPLLSGPFTNMRQFGYWTDRHSPSNVVDRFLFSTEKGEQSYVHQTFELYAVAVHDGDIGRAVVPEPGGLALAGAAMLGLAARRRRRSRAGARMPSAAMAEASPTGR